MIIENYTEHYRNLAEVLELLQKFLEPMDGQVDREAAMEWSGDIFITPRLRFHSETLAKYIAQSRQ